MPARVDGESGSLAVKVVSLFGGNVGIGIPQIQGAVIVLDPNTGQTLALLEGSSLTAIRTAAASGAATDLLAAPTSATLAILGAGVEARAHIDAMCAVRPITTIKVFSPTPANVDSLVAEFTARAFEISRSDSSADAVRESDIICTTTTSKTPVLEDSDVKPGAHINAIGTHTPDACEVSGATVARAWVVVDERAAAWAEAGDLIQPRDAGLIGEDHIRAEVGELVLDPALRPTSPDQVTLFKSVGIAVQDAVAATTALEAAKRLGLGTTVSL